MNFFLQRIQIYFFWGGGGGGRRNERGSVARDSVARVDEFFLQRIQIEKKNKYHHPSPCSYCDTDLNAVKRTCYKNVNLSQIF